MLSHIGAPSNYFEYTPYTSLSGVGGQTGDATVGHPYGFTNEYTVNSGSLHSPRTNAYTTDYGYSQIQLIMNELVWTSVTNSPSDNGTETTHTNLSAALMADALSTNVFQWDNFRYENGTFQ